MPTPNPLLSTLRQRLNPQAIGLTLTAAMISLYIAGLPLLEIMELQTYDQRLQQFAQRAPAGDVVIAAIDEKSLAAQGRWPWSRATMADLVKRIDALGAKAIVFDVFFSEAENREALAQIARLEAAQGLAHKAASPYRAVKRALATDAAFADAIADSGKVVLASVFLMSATEARHLSADERARARASIEEHAVPTIRQSGGSLHDWPALRAHGAVINLPELTRGARYVGHINSMSDREGTVRWAPLVIQYGDVFYPSADVQAVRLYKNDAPLAMHADSGGIAGLEIGHRFISTDEAGRVLIRYHGPAGTMPTTSIADIFAGKIEPAAVKNKIVIIGATAHGIGDIRVTPFGASYPGVEIRANTIQNLIDNDFNYRPGWMSVIDVAVLAILGIALSIALPRLPMREAALVAAGAITLYIVFAYALFRTYHVWMTVVYPTVLLLALFVYTTVAKYLGAERDKRQIKSAFAHYVPAAIVDEIAQSADSLALGGEKRELTVLFSDIRGFTGIAETLPPEKLVQLLNMYLTQMTEKVFAHDGLLDKYIGDAIMAVYGAPIARAEHARLACQTAVAMFGALAKLQAQWPQRGLPSIDIGVGVNTGAMIVGNMGSTDRFNYTVIGDAVNLGSRIETLNKTYGTHILLSETTYNAVKDDFAHLREIDHVRVRGRQERVRLFELMLAEHYPRLDWLPAFQRAYNLFHSGERERALPLFRELAETVADPVSRYYAERCLPLQRRTTD